MQADVVLVGKESPSHVEGVVGRQRGLWLTARPLVPSPAVLFEC